MTKFQRQLEEFLQMFGSMEEDNFLEAAPDCQNAIAFLWEEYRKMKEKSGNFLVTIVGGVADVAVFPQGFITGLEIRDFDVPEDYGNDVEGIETEQDECGDKYQRMIFEVKGESENS